MNTEEIINALEIVEHVESFFVFYEAGEPRNPTTVSTLKEACKMAISFLRTQVQSDAPLTLEELRKMDGEPIWIVHTDYTLFEKEYWGIVRDGFSGLPNCFVATRHGNVRLLYSEYGKTWIAYRRKPEAATPKANLDWCDHIKRRFEKVD